MAAYAATLRMTSDTAISDALERVPTRLSKFDADRQGHLINWGYALCDVSLRARVGLQIPMPTAWPVPEWPL